MVSLGELERIERGAYLATGFFDDSMYRLQRKHSRAIFSHETALYLHDLTDRDPNKYSVTVPSGYNASNLMKFPASVHYIRKDLYLLVETRTTAIFGNEVIYYNFGGTALISSEQLNVHIRNLSKEIDINPQIIL
ncbi:MAG: hypothetical protein LBN22_09765 [Clostridiales Family XIII bacterium]|nr:hypothetical protein [Clostridiales Family XIII bacterium]